MGRLGPNAASRLAPLIVALSAWAIMFAVPAVLAQTTVADSVAEFSATQGQDGWQYGTYAAFDATNFSQLPNFGADRWHGFQSFDTPFLDATGGHPGMDDLSWAVRRWTADVSGEVEISGTFFDRNTSCGDGSHVRVLQDGVEVYVSLLVTGVSTPYAFSLTVSAGQHIDFVIDPVLDSTCDETEFTALITQSGCGGSPGRVHPPTMTVDTAAAPAGDIVLTWPGSCTTGATDYGIYQGTIGIWYDHALVVCTDAPPALTEQVTPGSGSHYYLVVPITTCSDLEGSYGRCSSGQCLPGDERPSGAAVCTPAQEIPSPSDCP